MTDNTTTETNPTLYVGTYAKYNNGSIKGKWLTLTDYADAGSFLEACQQLHKDEADPELMFQDFEGFPESFYSESLGTQDLTKLYEWLALDEDDRNIVAEYANATGEAIDSIDLEQARDSYQTTLDGWGSKEQQYGEYVVEAGLFEVDSDSPIANYINYEKLGRDCLMDCHVSDNGYVFGSY